MQGVATTQKLANPTNGQVAKAGKTVETSSLPQSPKLDSSYGDMFKVAGVLKTLEHHASETGDFEQNILYVAGRDKSNQKVVCAGKGTLDNMVEM